jgi:glycosyltransferase involved in cell wall biosynthesis
LVVTSFDRQQDLGRFALSICTQAFAGKIEVSFVSQGSAQFRLPASGATHIQVITKSLGGLTPLSKARNAGMKELSGDIIAFPDDDCWYEPNLLATVANFFRDNPEIDCICTNVYDPVRRSVYGKRPVGITRRVSFINLFRLCISVGIFVRREALELAGAYFDETLGAGTPIGSGEETELLGRLLSRGCRIEYVGDIQVYHPVPHYSKSDVRKSYDYGVGFGHVNGRLLSAGHTGVLWGFAEVFARSCLGTVLNLPDPVRRAVYWNRMRGIFSGFLSVARINAAIPE